MLLQSVVSHQRLNKSNGQKVTRRVDEEQVRDSQDKKALAQVDSNGNILEFVNLNETPKLTTNYKIIDSANSDDTNLTISDSDDTKQQFKPECRDIKAVHEKVLYWFEKVNIHASFQPLEVESKEFFKWVTEEERDCICGDILSCFIENGHVTPLTPGELECAYFKKFDDAIPLELLLVDNVQDLLDNLEDIVEVRGGREVTYTVKDMMEIENQLEHESQLEHEMELVGSEDEDPDYSPSHSSSEYSLDDTQSSFDNSSLGYQTECEFNETLNFNEDAEEMGTDVDGMQE
uniref:DDE-1 domain-containing protein n=1 Tax=Rhabditophanes sp. KR3021 TaxID=114890 RepID=A0AC35TSB9_9BILA